jgi:Arc/MetJ-type ribon-helix-helix transcriptional regulator
MTTKIAVSLPDEVVTAARQAVAHGRASSVSAYIAATLADRQAYEDIVTLLADMASETGSPSPEDLRWARTALGLE